MSIARRGAIASSGSYTPPPGTGQIILGTRVNYGNSGSAAQSAIAGWGGSPAASVLMEYLNTASTWGTWPSSGVWNAVGGFAPGFTTWPGPKMIKVPIQVTSTPLTWTDVTGGGQDSNFTSFFQWCVSNGVQNLCPGWEGNLSDSVWPWATRGNDTTGNQTGYVAVWKHIWNLANAVSAGYFRWWWEPDSQPGGISMPNWAPGGAYYPGDSYVDVIGLDIYNTWLGGGGFPGDSSMLSAITGGAQPNWNQMLAYASAHNKGLCIPEWGMSAGSPDGGDDPTYINNLSALFVTAAQTDGLTVYAMPWDNTGASPISGYPNSNAAVATNVANWVSLGLTIGAGSPVVTPVPPQTATVGTPYTYTFTATGGTTPYTWTWVNQPAGLSLSSGGVVSGTPTTVETTEVTVTVHDNAGHTAPYSYSFGVTSSPTALKLGVFVGSGPSQGGSAATTTWKNTTGANITLAHTNLPWYGSGSAGTGWPFLASESNLSSWLAPFAGSPYQMVIDIPMVCSTAATSGAQNTLAQGATSFTTPLAVGQSLQSYWTSIAQNLVTLGFGNAILRLGWEFDGDDYFLWQITNSTDAGHFATYWQNIVTTMRAVSGTSFTFMWSAAGFSATNTALSQTVIEQAYPGNSYVDAITLDCYDWCFNNAGGWAGGKPNNATTPTQSNAVFAQFESGTFILDLGWMKSYAASKGKAMGLAEWACTVRTDDYGLGDDPTFISNVHSWATSNGAAYLIYFSGPPDPTTYSLTGGDFPNALAEYQALFGTGSVEPQYPPPGGVGALQFNFTAASQPSGTLNFPGFANKWFNGGEINQVYTANPAQISGGQLVLTLLDAAVGGQGMAVSSNPEDAAATPFQGTTWFREFSEVITLSGWWSSWQISQEPAYSIEFDATENLGGSIVSTLHWNNYAGQSQYPWNPQPTEGETVVVGVLWTEGQIELFVNGVSKHTWTSNVNNAECFLVHNMGYGQGTGATGNKARIIYDRVWALP